MKKSSPPLWLIEWEDSVGATSDWEAWDDMKEPKLLAVIKSVGYVRFSNKFAIMIVPHLGTDCDISQAEGCGVMVIPRSAVRRVVDLNTGKELPNE